MSVAIHPRYGPVKDGERFHALKSGRESCVQAFTIIGAGFTCSGVKRGRCLEGMFDTNMGKVHALPGDGCWHYIFGRCLYEERLNPGYRRSYRCQVLNRWEAAYDDFLARAEAMGVEQENVPELWEIQFQRMAREAFHCRTHVFNHDFRPPACANELDGLCILGLPKCGGRCRHYRAEDDPKREQEEM